MTDRIARPPAARRFARVCLAALSFALGSALAHEGHDEAPAALLAPQALAPRVAAASPDLELLGAWQDGALLIYLDRYATNEPVNGAAIELEAGANVAKAAPAGEGLYRAEAPWLAKPGKHPLVFTVRAADVEDLLQGTLEVPDRHSSHEPAAPTGWSARSLAYAGAAAVAALLLGALMAWGRRKRRQGRHA